MGAVLIATVVTIAMIGCAMGCGKHGSWIIILFRGGGAYFLNGTYRFILEGENTAEDV